MCFFLSPDVKSRYVYICKRFKLLIEILKIHNSQYNYNCLKSIVCITCSELGKIEVI
jgi:hypothetical protein